MKPFRAGGSKNLRTKAATAEDGSGVLYVPSPTLFEGALNFAIDSVRVGGG